MKRLAGAVIGGYLIMAVIVFGVFCAAYVLMGVERAFKPGTYEPSRPWVAVMLGGGLVAALVAGRVCAWLAQGGRGPHVLALLVLILGLFMAVPSLAAGGGEPRPVGLSNIEALENARTPAWVALCNPVVGAAGVLIGGGRRRRIEGL